jgi:hypothetical protein
MERSESPSPFGDLPGALVDEMLSCHKSLGQQLSQSFEEVRNSRKRIRDSLKELKFLRDDSTIVSSHVHPTTCGVDGAYAIERLLSTDIAAVAGVAVEGLTPPTERRLWPQPHHLCNVLTASHNDSTFLVIRAIMIAMEFELAANAPHDVVFLDGSLTTPVIHFNQAFSRISEVPEDLSKILIDRIEVALDSYKEILGSARSDKVYAGVPKYTSRNEISSQMHLTKYDDRAMLSFVLDGGEVVGPTTMLQSTDYWHFVGLPDSVSSTADRIISLIKELNVVYYRPYGYFPALRIEVAPSIARNHNRLSILLESLQLQCAAGLMEPYPLYLADRMVKHLGTALPAIRKATTQEMASSVSEELGNVFLAMHGYRTEYGR